MRRFPFTGGSLALLLAMLAAPNPVAAQAVREVTAAVLDSATGLPLAGAEIIAAGRSVMTDAEGRFRVLLESDTATVLVRRIGYAARRYRADDLPALLLLKPEPVLLTGITVTAAPMPGSIGLGSSLGLTTVEQAEIMSRGETSLASALSGVEGLSSSQPGAWGGKAFLRGLGGERVTVLLDGDRVNRACNVGMDAGLATISPATVERVEVLSGPGSVLYGSGNMGGVINVVTRGAPADRRMGGELRAGVSSAVPGGLLGGSFFARGSRLELDLSADGAAYDDYRSGTATIAGSGYRDATIDGRLAIKPGVAHRIALHVQRYLGRDIGYPTMAGMNIPTEDRLLTALDYGWQLNRGALDAVSAKLYRQGLEHDMRMTMTMSMAGMPVTSRMQALTSSATWGGRAEVRLRPAGSARLDMGVEATQWNADGSRWVDNGTGMPLTLRAWPDVRVLDVGTFTQGEVLAGKALALNGGVRLDRVVNRADAQRTTSDWVGSGNAGVRIHPGEGIVTRASLGFGYRIPDPTELYGLLLRGDGFLYQGNPSLQTERSRNLELAASVSRGRVDAGVTVFRNELYDLITPVLVPDSMIQGMMVRSYDNLTRARIDGLSGRVTLALPAALSLRGVASYTRGEDRRTGEPLALIPPLEGTATLRYARNGLLQWAELEAHGATRQDRLGTGSGELRTPGFAVLNARVMLAVVGSDVTVGAENLFDRTYRQHLDPVRLLRPGRNFYLRVRRPF